MGDWRIERLGRSHSRGEFACGKAPLDDFIRELVGQYEKRNLGRTYVALRPGGRLVANAVTLEGEAALLAAFAEHGGALKRLSVARADPVGGMHGWRSAMPVTQWTWVKRGETP